MAHHGITQLITHTIDYKLFPKPLYKKKIKKRIQSKGKGKKVRCTTIVEGSRILEEIMQKHLIV